MKALILHTDNGLEYDEYEQWPDACFLVPDDFNHGRIWNEFAEAQRKAGTLKLTQRGYPLKPETELSASLWRTWLSVRYQQVELAVKHV